MTTSETLLRDVGAGKFSTILADPPWQFQNRTGKMAPEHRRLSRYRTMSFEEIGGLPVGQFVTETAHLYLWIPNALLPHGIHVMERWGFQYKTNIVWYKVRKDGGPDRRGVGFYFRNVTEMLLFGVRGSNARTLAPGRRQENILVSRKREHSRKPDEQYELIEACSPGQVSFHRVVRPWSARGVVLLGKSIGHLLPRLAYLLQSLSIERGRGGRTDPVRACRERIGAPRRSA